MDTRRYLVIALIALVTCAVPAVAMADDDEPDQGVSKMLEALELPVQAQELRDAGVDEAQVNQALDSLRNYESAADESSEGNPGRAARAAAVLRAESQTAREEGPMDNFGEFVRNKLDEGLRGEELAESIREQRANRRPTAAGQGSIRQGQESERGREAPRGQQADERGRADERDQAAERGRAAEREQAEEPREDVEEGDRGTARSGANNSRRQRQGQGRDE